MRQKAFLLAIAILASFGAVLFSLILAFLGEPQSAWLWGLFGVEFVP